MVQWFCVPLVDENTSQTEALQGKKGLSCLLTQRTFVKLCLSCWRCTEDQALSHFSAVCSWKTAQCTAVICADGLEPTYPRQWQRGDGSSPTQAAWNDGYVTKSTLGWLFVQPKGLTDLLLSRLAFKTKLLHVNAGVRKDVSVWTHKRGKHICEMQI